MRCCTRPGTDRRGCPSRWSPSPMRDRPGPPDGPTNADPPTDVGAPTSADAPTEASGPAATDAAPQADPSAHADGPARTAAPTQAGSPGHTGSPEQAAQEGAPGQAGSPEQAAQEGAPGQAGSPEQAAHAGSPGQAGSPEQAGQAGAPGQAGSPERADQTGRLGPRSPAGTGSQPPPALPPPDASLRAAIDAIVAGASHDPHAVLGAHPGTDGVVVRALRPLAKTVTVVLPDGRRFPAGHLHQGVFAATLPVTDVPDYRVAVTYPGPGGAGQETIADDPYRHLPTLGEMDTYLIGEGRHEELWRVLGAHVRTFGPTAPAAGTGAGGARPTRPGETRERDAAGGTAKSFGSELGEVTGTSFAVWAPNA